MYHYVYYSYEEWGRGYIGVRSSKKLPEKDNYFGSYKDKSFKPTQKIVISTFKTRKDAQHAEILLHNFFSVVENLHFANRAKCTSTGFNRLGAKLSKKEKEKLKQINTGKLNPNFGKPRTKQTKEKQSKKLKGRKFSLNTKHKMTIAKKSSMKKILLVSIKTNEVFSFDSLNEAARTLGLNVGNISNLIHGRQKTTQGFKIAKTK